eukprot:5578129-Alexandrium_andersonii.AAC.1
MSCGLSNGVGWGCQLDRPLSRKLVAIVSMRQLDGRRTAWALGHGGSLATCYSLMRLLTGHRE